MKKGSEDRENVVCVIPYRPSDKSKYFQNHTSLTRVDEMKLISAVLSGYLDRFIFVAPSCKHS
ncbi:hypothetical protein RJ641_022024 [Dillenia turbinata]|uniref:Uncharacterized protein n=1 Tax=Dillenia turbinata TaxID=194707 RepID=A0AAN8YWP2_9MAGN